MYIALYSYVCALHSMHTLHNNRIFRYNIVLYKALYVRIIHKKYNCMLHKPGQRE